MGHALLPSCAGVAAAHDPAANGVTPAANGVMQAGIGAMPGVWRGRDLAHGVRPGIASGYAALDTELPGGGWPAGALTEVLNGQPGIGELRLFFPALGTLTRAGSPVFLLDPPWLPHAPAFASGGIAASSLIIVRPRRPADTLWACEQILKGLSDGALMAWPHHLTTQDARRLQLAVEGKPVLAVLMRPDKAVHETTPAALRIALAAAPQARLSLRILKRRGGVLARPIVVTPPSPLFARTHFPTPFVPHVVDRDPAHAPDARLHTASA
jgi:hypothetical protein